MQGHAFVKPLNSFHVLFEVGESFQGSKHQIELLHSQMERQPTF